MLKRRTVSASTLLSAFQASCDSFCGMYAGACCGSGLRAGSELLLLRNSSTEAARTGLIVAPCRLSVPECMAEQVAADNKVHFALLQAPDLSVRSRERNFSVIPYYSNAAKHKTHQNTPKHTGPVSPVAHHVLPVEPLDKT